MSSCTTVNWLSSQSFSKSDSSLTLPVHLVFPLLGAFFPVDDPNPFDRSGISVYKPGPVFLHSRMPLNSSSSWSHTRTHAHPPGLERSSHAPLVDELIQHHLEASELLSATQRTSLIRHCAPRLHIHTVVNTHCLVVSVLLLFNNYKDHVYVYMYCQYKMPPIEARFTFRSENTSCRRKSK